MSRDQSTREAAGQLLSQLANLIGLPPPATTSTVTASTFVPAIASTPTRPVDNRSTTAETTPVLSLTHGIAARAEVSRLFSPYPRPFQPQAPSFRLAGRQAGRSRLQPLQRQPRQWSGRFCCLGGPEDTKTPTDSRMLILKQCGLGDGVVIIGTTATAQELKHALRLAFPKLAEVEFQLYRALSGGKGKPIVQISNADQVPHVGYLRASRVSIIYVMPLQSVLDVNLQILDSHDDQFSEEEVLDMDLGNENLSTEQNLDFAGTSPTDLPVENAAMLTMESFREQMYNEHPGNQLVCLTRDRMLEKIIGIYKDPAFNLFRKPKIEFVGELGADIGGLTREYFWKGLTALIEEKIDGVPLFEGEMNHKVPTTDGRMLRTGIFKCVGKFMVHAAFHVGIAFVGLSRGISEYLTTAGIDSDTPFTLTVEDVPHYHIREALDNIQKLKSGVTLSQQEVTELLDVATTADFNEPISKDNASLAFDHILYRNVVECRSRQLDSIKLAFTDTPLFDFLKNKEYVVSGIFPRNELTQYPASLLIEKIRCNNDNIFSTIKDYIISFELKPMGLQNLLSAWTGWPLIPDGNLLVTVEEDVDFEVRTCFQQIQIPSSFTKDDLIYKLDLLLNYGSGGFGSF